MKHVLVCNKHPPIRSVTLAQTPKTYTACNSLNARSSFISHPSDPRFMI